MINHQLPAEDTTNQSARGNSEGPSDSKPAGLRSAQSGTIEAIQEDES
jgi:hypothetical protein